MARRMARRMAGRSGRRWRRGGGGPASRFFSMALAGVCAAAALTMFFRVRTVDVTGLMRYTPEDIRAAAEVRDGDNLFLLNKYAMMDQIVRELPYVESIRINRNLPDTLVIQVRECAKPLAIVQEGQAWLVSASGKLVDCVADTGEYGLISGCELLSPEVGTRLVLATEDVSRQQSLLNLLSALGEAQVLEQVDGIHLEDPGCIRMDYAGRFTVRLPYGADYAQKLWALKECLSREEIQENMTGSLDLTKDDKIYFNPEDR